MAEGVGETKPHTLNAVCTVPPFFFTLSTDVAFLGKAMSRRDSQAKTVTDAYRSLADKLRERKGVDYASAKLEGLDGDGEIVEFVRGKDLGRFLRSAPEKMEGLVQPVRPGEVSP